MSYLVRMIEIANWSSSDGQLVKPEDYTQVPADGITRDLKSDSNRISLWEIEELSELEEMAISILTSRSCPQDLFIVAIPKEKVENELDLEKNNDAETAFIKFQNRHYDLLNVNFNGLEILALAVLSALQNENYLYDFVFQQSKDKMKQYIESGEIDISQLKKNLKKEFAN